MKHLEGDGLKVEVEKVSNISEVKAHDKVPDHLQSCHTAIVDGYVVEGHVPKAEIMRMLRQRPNIVGLSVPGMPVGSPGMEMENRAAEPYQVVAFDKQGRTGVYANYPK